MGDFQIYCDSPVDKCRCSLVNFWLSCGRNAWSNHQFGAHPNADATGCSDHPQENILN